MSEPRQTPVPTATSRLAFLDWTRGLAVVIMLQGHVFHSFNTPQTRPQGPYMLSQLFGGIGPAVFLFLTGVTLSFLMDRRERQGLPALDRWTAALRRSGYLFLLAFLFRVQAWVFGYPGSPTAGLLKVDILNCMGFAIGLFTLLAFLRTAQRVKAGAVLGVAIAGLAPMVSAMRWSWLPQPVSAYFVPSFDNFAFFPWASFIAFGISAGSIVRLLKADQIQRVMQWSALAGFGLVIGAQYFSNLPYTIYSNSEFWLNSPGLVFIKLGVVLLIAAGGYLGSEYGLRGNWSAVRQLGMTSLLVYWVHIELVYGRWFGYWKNNLTNVQCVLASVAVIGAMLGLSLLRTHWGAIAARFKRPGRREQESPARGVWSRAAGD